MIYIWIYFTRKEKKGKIRHRKVKTEIKGRREKGESRARGNTKHLAGTREKRPAPLIAH